MIYLTEEVTSIKDSSIIDIFILYRSENIQKHRLINLIMFEKLRREDYLNVKRILL